MARGGYYRKIEAAGVRCTCWDCIRAVGVTPPVTMRDKHKRLYPQAEMTEDIDSRGRMDFKVKRQGGGDDKVEPDG